MPVTLNADLEVKLNYNTGTGDGRNLIGPSNNSAYYWRDVEVLAYDAEGNVVFGPSAVGEMDEDNPYLDLVLESWDGDTFRSGVEILAANAGYSVTARQAGVSLRFPQNAQTEIEDSSSDDNSGGGSGGCFAGSLLLLF